MKSFSLKFLEQKLAYAATDYTVTYFRITFNILFKILLNLSEIFEKKKYENSIIVDNLSYKYIGI